MALVPYDKRDGKIWYNGEMVDWVDAKVHVLNHGLHYGSCVFEGNRVYNGKIFKLTEHSERLKKSAEILGFDIPYSVEEIDEICRQSVAVNNIVDGYVRPVAWRGSEMMAISAQQTSIHFAVASWVWPAYFGTEALEKGVRLKMADYRRPAPDMAPVHAKAAGLYMICTVSKHKAEAAGYTDALMLDYRGQIAEATGANIFFIKDGEIHTPIADCFLDGITRRTVIDLARQKGLKVIERAIMPDELGSFEECFLTGSAAEVTPVGEIEGTMYTVGDITRGLMQDYGKLVRGELEMAA